MRENVNGHNSHLRLPKNGNKIKNWTERREKTDENKLMRQWWYEKL
jgi:hypothetical protein